MAKKKRIDNSVRTKRKQIIRAIRQENILILEQSELDPEKSFLKGIWEDRIEEAILNCFEKAESVTKQYDLDTLFPNMFIRSELYPFTINYNVLDYKGDIQLGASLWILDKLRTHGQLLKATSFLNEVNGKECLFLPADFYHPCYSNELIQSMMNLLQRRYPDCQDKEVVITEMNTRRKRPTYQPYNDLIALLPRKEIEKACNTFRSKIWELSSRKLKVQGYYSRIIREIADELIKTSKPPTSFFDAPRALAVAQNNMAIKARPLISKSTDIDRHFDQYLAMDRDTILKNTGSSEVADILTAYTLEDPYELCFALFYLMDSGDDSPWLMRSGFLMMYFVIQMLPWYITPDDLSDKELATLLNGLHYDQNGWMSMPRQDPVDFYHTKHGGRNLAQIVYMLCRGVVPVGMHPFEKEKLQLIQEGMEERVANRVIDAAEYMFHAAFQASHITPFSWDVSSEPKDPEHLAETEEPVDSVPSFTEILETYLKSRKGKNIGSSPEEREKEGEGQSAEDELQRLQKKLSATQKQVKNLQKVLAETRQEASRERTKYERELKELRMEHQELTDLRELVFNQEAEEPERLEKLEKDYSYPYTTVKRTVIFGGHDSFLKLLKPMLPSVRFVDADNLTFNPEIIRRAEVVWIQTNHISHTQYFNIVKHCKLNEIQMHYFSYSSPEKCAEQLVTEDLK